ncbi:hypothetical protein DUNSADRAFT_5962 [Dunaliella salina]|uniref:Rieske domain-containing protein n=1 Tax=Dunaliella salina TaxID=3046 RepID=A0ABQ7GP74_DUNSA|nr:hypothetical protein DUNSADRAFT_5962 [Dunaliella salina]|eukprot:KAF5836392.1 hypothetical protein DUNSADRAFT_5962 [Dunaliella salina]
MDLRERSPCILSSKAAWSWRCFLVYASKLGPITSPVEDLKADRYVTLLRRSGKLYGIDSICFHAGGPLGIGDIEDVNGNPCLVCPWHYYKVDMATGDKYYQQVKFENGKMVPGGWASNGIKQRAHTVTEVDGSLYLQVSSQPIKVDSDQYAGNEACGERVIKAGGHVQQPGPNTPCFHVGGDGKKLPPSGAIMKAARLTAQKSPLSAQGKAEQPSSPPVSQISQRGSATECDGEGGSRDNLHGRRPEGDEDSTQ